MELLAFNKDLYLGIVFIHIFAAIIWVGGAFTFQLRIAQLRKANDTTGFLQLGQDAERWGQRVFMPASIVVLLAGITMVWYGPYSFKLWIGLALVGIVLTSLVGALYLGPQGGKFAQARAGTRRRGPGRGRRSRPADPRLADRLPGAGADRARHGVQAGPDVGGCFTGLIPPIRRRRNP